MVTTGNDTIQENWILSLITPLQVLRGEIWYSAQRWIETDKGLARANGIRFVGEGVEIESYQPLTPIKVYN